MNRIDQSDILILSALRGRFEDSKNQKRMMSFYSTLFMVLLPCIFLYCLFERGAPEWPYDSDQLALIVLIPAAIALGLFFNVTTGGFYVFNGEYVVSHKSDGREKKRLKISDLIRLKVSSSRGVRCLELSTETDQMNVVMYDDLQVAINKLTAEQVGACGPDISGANDD